MRIRNRLIASTAIIAGLLALSAGPALAATPNFGSHVRVCAQTMGFSGTLNPGMHRGAAGWDGEPCR
ncbi:MAG TPA: hypothetical protein VFF32_00895 [Dermatophilaceae bacterium]|nr:hypothetical protein [Dermatophilaceae bacterium]